MWILGSALMLVVVVGVALLVEGRQTRPKLPLLWDTPRVAGSYTGIVGTLAGFTVASSYFAANLWLNRSGAQFEMMLGMLLIGFLVLVGTAMTFATVPNAPRDRNADEWFAGVQSTVYLLAITLYYAGLSITWFSLRLLLLAIGLPALAEVMAWLLLFVAYAGASRLSTALVHYSFAGRLTGYVMPALGLAGAAGYRLGLAAAAPGLWPASRAPLAFSVLLFVMVGVGFFSSNNVVIPRAFATKPLIPFLTKERLLLVYNQCVVTLVFALWFAVTLA